MMAVWGAFALLMLIVSLFSTVMKWVALLLFLGATGATVQQIWKLLRARQAVLERKDVPLLWGFVRLIAWDPIQGVLVLKNKVVSFSDDNLHDGQGGVRFLYPVLGEELALRVPLEVQTLRFADSNILTQEYLRVSARGTMKWRIVDVRKFYLLVSRELRSTSDTQAAVTVRAPAEQTAAAGTAGGTSAEAMLTSAMEWMRILAEEQTRMVISRTKSGLLMADRLSQELSGVAGGHSAALPALTDGSARVGSEWGGAADGLARAIHATIAERLEDYGIAVDDVSLQEIKLPEEVVEECIAAAKAYYTPMRAQREAAVRFAERAAELRADVELLGKEAVGTREVVGAAPAFALTDFVSNYLNKRMAAPAAPGAPGAGNVDLMIGAAVAGQLAGHVAKGEEAK
jgi:regulator of protease activity HflC (stomatin/prohibitin superfamily)